ncbi:MAG TPA: hypothetical protein DEF12_13050 [Rhodobacteraceae bacterium]|jgi:hypothetical protein|nr:hypothetical protein [Paracoccaceae bacterium]HBV55943.1 hypothetical protein [Paracoccaceae bacterium]
MRRVIVCLLIWLGVTGCARPLSDNERAFLAGLHGPSFAQTSTRLSGNLAVTPYLNSRKPRPRVTCVERVYPPVTEGRVWVAPAAMAGFHTVWFRRDIYRKDFLAGWPDAMDLDRAMLFAHEMTHIWQWQERARTGYSPLKGALEHVTSDDPYLFDPETQAEFLAFGYEQQASIVEEFVCCRALAPDAPRTHRLRAMLAQVMDVPPLGSAPRPQVQLPWAGATRAGICD